MNKPPLSKQDGVVKVTADELVNQDTSSTPTFLGLTDPDGLWNQLGGPAGSKRDRELAKGLLSGLSTRAFGLRAKAFPTATRTETIYQAVSFKGKCESTETVTDGSGTPMTATRN
jgi:hypothetical protein